jgi:hypothetical protein
MREQAVNRCIVLTVDKRDGSAQPRITRAIFQAEKPSASTDAAGKENTPRLWVSFMLAFIPCPENSTVSRLMMKGQI